jgi:hypothetical protein
MKDNEIEQAVTRVLNLLQAFPPREAAASAHGKANFLKEAAAMRSGLSSTQTKPAGRHYGTFLPAFPGRRHSLAYNVVISAVLAVMLFFGGTGITVVAAQSSLPGQSLYPVKIWAEDTSLALTSSPQSRLEEDLDYSDRRISEMAGLVSAGKPIPEMTYIRLQNELENALDLASGLETAQMQPQLQKICQRAGNQLQAVNALLAAPSQVNRSVLLQVQERIQEQVRFCTLGESDPQGFKLQIQELQRNQSGTGGPEPGPGNGSTSPAGKPPSNGSPSGPNSGNSTNGPAGTPMPEGNGSDPGGNQSSATPLQPGPGPQPPSQTQQPGGGQQGTPQPGGTTETPGSGKGPGPGGSQQDTTSGQNSPTLQ